jgi:hypothetical protein
MKVKFDTSLKQGLRLKKLYEGVRYGIELEYEGCELGHVPYESYTKYWSTTHDHSLRAGGVEFISKPLAPSKLDEALSMVKDAIVESGAHISKRCGVHVHLNVTDLTFRELWQVYTLYAAVEPFAFKQFADTREDSHFCVPLWANTAMQHKMFNDASRLRLGITQPPASDSVLMQNPGPSGGLMRSPIELSSLATAKYSAMNVQALLKFGTLEFRQLPGTTDMRKVRRWCEFLGNMREYARSFESPEAIATTLLNEGYAALLPECGLDEALDINPDYVEDAIDACVMLVGHERTNPNDLDWEI